MLTGDNTRSRSLIATCVGNCFYLSKHVYMLILVYISSMQPKTYFLYAMFFFILTDTLIARLLHSKLTINNLHHNENEVMKERSSAPHHIHVSA